MSDVKKFLKKISNSSIYYDFEFIDLGQLGTKIISIGAITKNLGGIYYINSDFFKDGFIEYINSNIETKDFKWMADNVFKHISASAACTDNSDITHVDSLDFKCLNELYDRGVFKIKAKKQHIDGVVCGVSDIKGIGNEFHKLASRVYAANFDMNLVGYYSSHDHMCMANLYGGMSNIPNPIPDYTHCLRSFGCIDGIRAKIDGPHHPYYDAKLTMELAEKMSM